MLNKNRYWKSTLGVFADVLIAKQVDYSGTGISTVSDYPTFVSTAVEGEFAFFNSDTLALIGGTTANPSGYIFGAVKRDGYVEKTLRFRLSDYDAKRVVYAPAVNEVATATFSGTAVAGSYYSVSVIETTPGYQAFPRWEYGVTAKTGESLATILGRILVIINDQTNVINKSTDSIVTATLSNTVLTLTANIGGPSFRLAFSRAAIEEVGAAAAVTTPPFWGNGTFEQVAELEQESDVYKGVGTQYPSTPMANAADFGKPSVFATVGVTYNIYLLRGVKAEMSHTPVDQHQQRHNIILAIPSNGAANAESEVKSILVL